MNDLILETKELCKNFKGQMAVNNVSLKVRRNSIYGLLGPNGAGKSTTLKMITGMLRADSGKILFEGHKWSRISKNHYGMGLFITNSFIKLSGGIMKLSNSERIGGAKVVLKVPLLPNLSQQIKGIKCPLELNTDKLL